MANWCRMKNERELTDNIIERKLRVIKGWPRCFNKTGNYLSLNDLNKALFVTVYLAFVTHFKRKIFITRHAPFIARDINRLSKKLLKRLGRLKYTRRAVPLL